MPRVLLLAMLLVVGRGAHAAVLNLDVLDNSPGNLTVAVVASDLGGSSIAGFDFNIGWTPAAALEVALATFGNALDGDFGGSFQTVTPGLGTVNLAEGNFSGFLPGQPAFGSLTLVTVDFNVLAEVPVTLSLEPDFLGNFLLDDTFPGTAIDLSSAPTPVSDLSVVPAPAPPALALMLGGLVSLAAAPRLRRGGD